MKAHSPQPVRQPNHRTRPERIRAQQPRPPVPGPALRRVRVLPDRQRHKVVHQTATENPVAQRARNPKSDARQHLDEAARRQLARVVCGGGVVQEVEDADAGEGLADDVGEEGRGGGGAEGGQARAHVGELGEGVDDDEDVGGAQVRGVPEEHPSC